MARNDGRQADQLRPVKITRNYIKHAEGSVLIEMGDTKVICTATIEEKVPPFLKGSGKGWITAEYSMLPRSAPTRVPRESSRGKVTGRTHEIQRLIGRSLRSIVNLEKLGERTIHIDCDVIQADGGTRTASITGSFVALIDSLDKLLENKSIEKLPVNECLAAVSVGKINGEILLDLDYSEDSVAEVDMNIIMTEHGKFVEVQGTAEDSPFSKDELESLLEYGKNGVNQLIAVQKQVMGELSSKIGI